MEMPVNLNGKTALVTGGANGIGLAVSRELAACGARVWVARRDKYLKQIQETWIDGSAKRQAELGQPVTADKNWIFVKPDEIQ